MLLYYLYFVLFVVGELIEVVFGIFWLCMLLLFQFDYINFWLLCDGDGWIIVDIGFFDDDVWVVWLQIIEWLDGLVKCLIVIYFYLDYFGLVIWLMEQIGVLLWMISGEFLIVYVVWYEVVGYGVWFMVE